MHQRSRRLKALGLVLLMGNLILGLPLQAQDVTQQEANPRQEVSCGRVRVTDFPLNMLILGIVRECNRKLIPAEDLPTSKVTFSATAPLPQTLTLLGKYGLAFQPVRYEKGKFESDGYHPGLPLTEETWMSCFLADDKSQPVAEKKVRLFRDPRYRLIAKAASAKEIIDSLHRLYGGNFAQQLTQALKVVGVDLATKDVTLSLDETANELDDALKSRLVKKILAPQEPSNKPKSEPEIWPLTFIPGNLRTDGRTPASGERHTIDRIVDSLNAMFKERETDRDVVQRARQYLLLSGSQETNRAVKRLLAKVDVPWPQVQLTMWAIQASGQADVVANQLLAIRQDIFATQKAIAEAQGALNLLIAHGSSLYPTCSTAPPSNETLCKLRLINFNRQPDDALSLNEALIFLALHPQPSLVVSNWRNEVEKIHRQLNGTLESIYQRAASPSRVITPFIKQPSQMEKIYRTDTRGGTLQAINRFIEALVLYKAQDPQAPESVRRESAVVDRLLKSAMDAFAQDMEEIFLQPLLYRIQAFNGGPRQGEKTAGVTLTGRTRIVVTSGLVAGLEPEMASYVETTRPKPFGQDLLNLAFPAARSSERSRTEETTTSAEGTTETTSSARNAASTVAEGLTGAAGVLAGLSPASAVLLAGALLSDVEPTYSKVAPGISIKVQPTVLADGAAARLVLDCRFGVKTEALGSANRTDVWTRPPADAIQSHHFTTDAAVSVFELFDISSFSIETSHPAAPFYIPILGRMPVIGPAFQWPRDDKQVHQESIILVNAIILPRALDLSRYYGDSNH